MMNRQGGNAQRGGQRPCQRQWQRTRPGGAGGIGDGVDVPIPIDTPSLTVCRISAGMRRTHSRLVSSGTTRTMEPR